MWVEHLFKNLPYTGNWCSLKAELITCDMFLLIASVGEFTVSSMMASQMRII